MYVHCSTVYFLGSSCVVSPHRMAQYKPHGFIQYLNCVVLVVSFVTSAQKNPCNTKSDLIFFRFNIWLGFYFTPIILVSITRRKKNVTKITSPTAPSYSNPTQFTLITQTPWRLQISRQIAKKNPQFPQRIIPRLRKFSILVLVISSSIFLSDFPGLFESVMAGQRNDCGLISTPKSEFNEVNRRRNPIEERESNAIGPDDTVYRYLCPLRRIGCVIGIGGEIAKQLRAETHAKIRISEVIPGCEERVVTIYSSSEETNVFGDDEELVSPAQEALFKVHDKVTVEEPLLDEDSEESYHVTVRLLVGSDQIGCVIGKGGQVVQSIRSETGAQVRIFGTEHLPPCAIASDELIQISGEAYAVKRALFRVAFLLHENPSQSQHQLLSLPSIYRSGVVFSPVTSALGGGYRGTRNTGGNRSGSVKEFSICLVCPVESVGAVIGKGGAVIKQIRQESRALIKIDTSDTEADNCVISVLAKETFEDFSSVIDAAMQLQPRCSVKIEKESDEDSVITTRLLVPRSRVGCLIGKGGSIINEMRNTSKATIRVLSEESLPKFASSDDEMVQITGELSVASNALYQVLSRLRANLFEVEGSLATVPPLLPNVPTFPDHAGNSSRNANRDTRGARTRGYPTGSHNPRNSVRGYGYGGVQSGGRNRDMPDGIYSSGRSSNW